MRKNRMVGSVEIALRSIWIYAAAALIIRLIIAEAYIVKYSGEYISRYAPKGDEFTWVLLFLCGFFMYRRHTGLCASVNLSAGKKMFGLAAAGIITVSVFALFDLINARYILGDPNDRQFEAYWESNLMYEGGAELLSPDGAALIYKMILVYLMFWSGGYIFRHLISVKSPLTLFHAASAVLYGIAIIISDNQVLFMITAFVMIVNGITASPLTMGFMAMLFCGIHSTAVSLAMATLFSFFDIGAAAYFINRFKPKMRREKRGGI